MDIGGLDAALAPWRREREEAAHERMQLLAAQERELRHEAHEERERASRALGKLGVHASAAKQLDAMAGKVRKRWDWYKRCRARVRCYEERRAACGEESYEGICGHCGMVHEWPKRCGAHVVCAECARARANRLTRKLVPAIRLANARSVTKWHAGGRQKKQRPMLALITLTIKSVDVADLAERRKLLPVAWNRFMAWYRYTYKSDFPYAWTIECTEGTRNQGHVHAHVIAMIPFRAYTVLDAAWKRALRGYEGSLHVPKGIEKKRTDPKSAARYIAKYASKGVKFVNVQTAAAWVRASHGRRGVSTSRGWWFKDTSHHRWQLTLKKTPSNVDKSSSRSDPTADEIDGGTRGDTRSDERSAGPS